MLKTTITIPGTLSMRISTMVVAAISILLGVVIIGTFHYTKRTMREEALQKAVKTLDNTMQNIDIVLMSAEQASGNMYLDLLQHLDKPERMETYCRHLVEDNPYITGCAIAFTPYYYPEREQYFIKYAHKTSSEGNETTIVAESYGNEPYTEQKWFTQPMTKGTPCWINPSRKKDNESEAIITFSLPLYERNGKIVGVLAVDVSLLRLSNIVLAAKPSPNSYATLINSEGSFIVHPDSNKLFYENIFSEIDEESNASASAAAQAMMRGETGYKKIKLNNKVSYVFYRPFVCNETPGRYMENLNWSVGIVYPENDIIGNYSWLFYIVLSAATAGVLILLLLCYAITHRQLKPLRQLTASAQNIAEGNYNHPIKVGRQTDEVGLLQRNFQKMQQALAINVGELERLNTTLIQHGQKLEEAYEQAKDADKAKTSFLHDMTNKMVDHVEDIQESVEELCALHKEMKQEDTDKIVNNIKQQAEKTTKILDELFGVKQEQIGV